MAAYPRPWRQTLFALPAFGLMVMGLFKAWQHQVAGTADPFAAAWCRSPLAAEQGADMLLLGHCWGCYATAVGALMLLFSLFSPIASIRTIRPTYDECPAA